MDKERDKELRVLYWAIEELESSIFHSRELAPEFVKDTTITKVYDKLRDARTLIETIVEL